MNGFTGFGPLNLMHLISAGEKNLLEFHKFTKDILTFAETKNSKNVPIKNFKESWSQKY
jgi:hypothetical protein